MKISKIAILISLFCLTSSCSGELVDKVTWSIIQSNEYRLRSRLNSDGILCYTQISNSSLFHILAIPIDGRARGYVVLLYNSRDGLNEMKILPMTKFHISRNELSALGARINLSPQVSDFLRAKLSINQPDRAIERCEFELR